MSSSSERAAASRRTSAREHGASSQVPVAIGAGEDTPGLGRRTDVSPAQQAFLNGSPVACQPLKSGATKSRERRNVPSWPAPSVFSLTRFSQTLIDRSGYADDTFTRCYDRFRPAPPAALLQILKQLAQVKRPGLVVDLGAGTGLSTRVWASEAERIVGVEADEAMIAQARRATTAGNVEYVKAFARESGMEDGAADIVTCAQAFHWMEPQPVLREAGRILRGGGVFAAYDYDVPPVVCPDVDVAFAALFEARRSARGRLGLEAGAATWPKERHLEQLRRSGCFRSTREVVCHAFAEIDAERLVGLAESIGGPRAIFGDAAPEVGETFDRLQAVAERVLRAPHPMVVCYRIRVGIK